MKRVALVLLLAACASVHRADDDAEFERAKAEFESIARQDETGRARRGEPSLTSLVRTFLAHDPALVARVESHWWNASKRADLWASRGAGRIETTIRFLHALDASFPAPLWDDEPADPIYVVGGAVVVRDGDPYFGLAMPPFAGTYEELVDGHALRPSPAPSARALLTAVEDSKDGVWSQKHVASLATALGECCARDDDAYDELSRRSATLKPAYLLALGWTRRPAAAGTLVERLRALIESDDPHEHGALDAAAVALRHADADAFERFVASLDVATADRVVGATDAARLVDRLLARLAAAQDRRRGSVEFCYAVRADAERLRGIGIDRLLRPLLDACSDPETRSIAENSIDRLIEFKRLGRFGGSGGAWLEDGSHFGWPGTVEELLRRLIDDIDSGRLAAAEAAPPFEAARTAEDHGPKGRIQPSGAPVGVAAEWTETGLRLTLRNDGPAPLSIDATSLRYPWADLVTVSGDARTPGTDRRLRLSFGHVGFGAFTPASTLVALAPGASWTCGFPVSPKLRDVDHVEVRLDGFGSLSNEIAVVGTASAPIARFERIAEP